MMKIQVCLATYNGEKYLKQQIESIQSNLLDCEILIHDDGSTDRTNKIISAIDNGRTPLRILPSIPAGGAKENFNYLLSQTTAPYIFCSDQDDIWHPDKLSIFMEAMDEAEKKYGPSTPLLIHSDLRVIDSSGKVLMESFWKYQRLNPKWGGDMRCILTQNVVTGCAMMVNRALLIKALPIPEAAVMHDWWLALVACAFGEIIALPIQTVDYRQHSNNEVGAKKFDLHYIVKRVTGIIGRDEISNGWRKSAMQAFVFAERFPGVHGNVAEQFAGLADQSYLRRLQTKLIGRFWKIGIVRNIGWLFL